MAILPGNVAVDMWATHSSLQGIVGLSQALVHCRFASFIVTFEVTNAKAEIGPNVATSCVVVWLCGLCGGQGEGGGGGGAGSML